MQKFTMSLCKKTKKKDFFSLRYYIFEKHFQPLFDFLGI